MKAVILAALLACGCSNTPLAKRAWHELTDDAAPSCTCAIVILDGEGKVLKEKPPRAGE